MNRSQSATLLILTALGVTAGFQNCSNVAFTGAAPAAQVQAQSTNSSGSASISSPATSTTPSSTVSGSIPVPALPINGGTTISIKQFKPALAVRDVSCLACHANVQATVITDFGFSDPWFLDGYINPTGATQAHYSADNLQTLSQVVGQMVIPTVALPAGFVQAQQAPGATPITTPTVDLMSYLTRTDLVDYYSNWFSYFGQTAPATNALTNNVEPATGTAAIVEESTIYIGAPTVAEVLAIVPGSTATAPWVEVKGASVAGLSGLSVVTGANGMSYVVTTGPVQCSNQDVVVNGTLLINNGSFYAENGGCRLYVTGSVFIEGPITYLNSGATADPTDNLQITSATSIMMGVGLNGQAVDSAGDVDQPGNSPLLLRLQDDIRNNMLLREATTTAAYTTFTNSILAEANNIGMALIQDASVPGSLPTEKSAAGQSRAAITFQHLLVNAPLVHSRYMGTFTGVVVAESALFSLGEFSFAYDPVFATVPILPGLPYDIVCTGTPCNPANP